MLAALVITVTVAGALGLLAARQRDVLTEQLDDQLQVVAANLDRDNRAFDTTVPEESERQGFPSTGEIYFAVLDTDGSSTVIARPVSRSNLEPDLTREQLAAEAESGAPFTIDVTGAEGTARAIAVDLGAGRFAVVAVSTSAVDAAQDQLVTTAVVALAVIITTMAVVFLSVDRLGIRPIAAITDAAEDIAAGRSERRVTHPSENTEAGRLGASFNTMLDARQAAEGRQRRFVADASHELRTPLTTLRGYAALHAGGELTTEETNDAVARIHSEAKRMEALVDDLLTLASLDDDRPMQLGTVDITELLHDIADDAQTIQPDRTIHKADIEPNIEIDADRHQLTQAVTTIVSNALRHTPRAARVWIAAETSHDETRIIIGDDGPGIEPEHLDRLFERFYRADPGRTRAAGGFGLGLSIAQAIVEAHNGTIAAASEIGTGTTITITLPNPTAATGHSTR